MSELWKAFRKSLIAHYDRVAMTKTGTAHLVENARPLCGQKMVTLVGTVVADPSAKTCATCVDVAKRRYRGTVDRERSRVVPSTRSLRRHNPSRRARGRFG